MALYFRANETAAVFVDKVISIASIGYIMLANAELSCAIEMMRALTEDKACLSDAELKTYAVVLQTLEEEQARREREESRKQK